MSRPRQNAIDIGGVKIKISGQLAAFDLQLIEQDVKIGQISFVINRNTVMQRFRQRTGDFFLIKGDFFWAAR